MSASWPVPHFPAAPGVWAAAALTEVGWLVGAIGVISVAARARAWPAPLVAALVAAALHAAVSAVAELASLPGATADLWLTERSGGFLHSVTAWGPEPSVCRACWCPPT